MWIFACRKRGGLGGGEVEKYIDETWVHKIFGMCMA